jgi:hypothetical protein
LPQPTDARGLVDCSWSVASFSLATQCPDANASADASTTLDADADASANAGSVGSADADAVSNANADVDDGLRHDQRRRRAIG